MSFLFYLISTEHPLMTSFEDFRGALLNELMLFQIMLPQYTQASAGSSLLSGSVGRRKLYGKVSKTPLKKIMPWIIMI